MSEMTAAKKTSLLKMTRRLLPLSMKYDRNFFLFCNALSVVHGACWGVAVFARQWFFDAATDVSTGNATLGFAIWTLVVYGLVITAQQAMNGASNFFIGRWFQRFAAHMKALLALKAGRVNAVLFENPKSLDGVNKAQEGAMNSAMAIFTPITVLTFYVPYFLVIAAYLYTRKPILAVGVLLVFVPVALTQFIRAKVFTDLEEKLGPVRRKYEYFEKAVDDRDSFKETRLLGNYRFLKRLFNNALADFGALSAKAEKRTARWELLMKLITLSGYMGILYMLFSALMADEITIGAFASVFAELGAMFGIMEEVICRHIGGLTKQVGTVKNFVDFLYAPEREGEAVDLPAQPEIRLEDVHFKYPGAEKEAVRGVTLTVKPGETLAVVGENGAGKTTLVRLLTGLYLPTAGKATVDGRDMGNVHPKSLFLHTSAAFQRYMRYRMTLLENVRVSAPDSEAEIEGSLARADLSPADESFPDRENTMLSREFEGVDLSGGQWQRVALARGFYRDHGVIVLDEPTAAIDPLEETRVYRKFAEVSADVTAIIVTHRIGSARIADRIIVMDEGVIEEEGSHEELLARGGHYAEMVNAQADWYR